MNEKKLLEIYKQTGFPNTMEDLLAFASALEAALLEGKCLVPVEPTGEQVQRGVERWLQELENESHGAVGVSIQTRVAKIYKAMTGGE